MVEPIGKPHPQGHPANPRCGLCQRFKLLTTPTCFSHAQRRVNSCSIMQFSSQPGCKASISKVLTRPVHHARVLHAHQPSCKRCVLCMMRSRPHCPGLRYRRWNRTNALVSSIPKTSLHWGPYRRRKFCTHGCKIRRNSPTVSQKQLHQITERCKLLQVPQTPVAVASTSVACTALRKRLQFEV